MKKYRIVILEHQESSLFIIETTNNRSNKKKFDYQLMTKDDEYTITYSIRYKGKEHLEIYINVKIFFSVCRQEIYLVFYTIFKRK